MPGGQPVPLTREAHGRPAHTHVIRGYNAVRRERLTGASGWSVVGGRVGTVGGRGRWSVVGGRWSVGGDRGSVVGGRWTGAGPVVGGDGGTDHWDHRRKLVVGGDRSLITDHRPPGGVGGRWGRGDRSPTTDHRPPRAKRAPPIGPTDHRPPRPRRERLRPWRRRPTVAACSRVSFTRWEGRSPRRSDNRRNVSVSANEPLAIPRNCRNSLVPCRSAPSAMFAGTDVTARRNWLVNPYRSSAGNRRRQPPDDLRQLHRLLPHLKIPIAPGVSRLASY